MPAYERQIRSLTIPMQKVLYFLLKLEENVFHENKITIFSKKRNLLVSGKNNVQNTSGMYTLHVLFDPSNSFKSQS